MNYLTTIQLFARAAELGSFSKAAAAFNLKKSSVSRYVASLEEDLGTPLFRRSTRKVVLTDAGHSFYESATRILAELEDARRNVVALSADPVGVLKIHAPVEFGRRHIAPSLPDFLSENPGLSVDLTLSDASVDMVTLSTDVVIHIGELKNSRLFSRKIASNRYVVCGSPLYLQHAGVPKHPSELSRHSCLGLNTGGENVWNFDSPRSTVGVEVEVNGKFRTNNIDALLEATVGGVGLARLPTWLASPLIRDRRLQVVLQDYTVIPHNSDINAVYPEKRAVSPKLNAFLNFLSQRMGNPPHWDH